MADNTTSSNRSEADILKILVATDIHLGFEEKDPIRDQDTFDTFEEILQIAFTADVDFILLGGDLFHHAKPSPYCIFKCTELLRRYCLGDKPVAVEFLSDPSHNFTNTFNPVVNYEDPNLNVSIPVFSIHGNHDDPTGHRQISAMDLLATSGLVNYFGRYHSYDEVNIEPILLKKGETKLALYGLSHIKDEKLGRLFLDKKVKILSPEKPSEWFHLLVWHQNRAARGTKNFIPDDSLPEFLHLVVWGHEHDCRIVPEKSNKVWITQPGSSVATSLAEGEAKPKHVGILKIHHDKFKLTPVPLKTVRPFIYRDLILKTPRELEKESSDALSVSELTMNFIKKEIDSMIEESKTLGRVGRASQLPLLRLNVKYKDERQVFNAIRFGQSYMGKVANPEGMIKSQSIKTTTIKRKKGSDSDLEEMEVTSAERVEDIILSHFEQNPDILKCLPLPAINEGVKRFVDANDSEAPILAVNELIQETLKKIEEDMPEIDELDEYIRNFKIIRENNSLDRISNLLNDPKRSKKHSVGEMSNEGDVVDIDDDEDDVSINDTRAKNTTPAKPAKGSASRGGKGSRGGGGPGSRGRGSRGRGKNTSDVQSSSKKNFWG